jgi:hypothetical protein
VAVDYETWMPDALDAQVKGDTIVYVTATQGEDRPVYFND